jgi:XTP/dITP diphosphohydrolase
VTAHISLITGNEGKASEYSALLGIPVSAVQEDLIEIQSLDVREVVRRKAEDAYAKLRRPVLVDDTGLALKAWNGLPGALIKWFVESVGAQGVLDMAAGLADRRALAFSALGYADSDGVRVYTGSLAGTLTTELRGTNGFGYDPIFLPSGEEQTYAEMSIERKNKVSHRRLAVENLRNGLLGID